MPLKYSAEPYQLLVFTVLDCEQGVVGFAFYVFCICGGLTSCC